MMANASLLFVDPKQTSTADIDDFKQLHAQKLPEVPLQVISFFSSKFEDLQLISKHRVVSLPTYVATTPQNRTAFRISGNLPTANSLDLLTGEGK
jgi:hypothetical protein